ncbi:unnamed protein product, partial [Scytosiphon promiscuus]
MEELRAKWNETVRELAKRGIAVTNPENALEGALSIRILKPLLNHKDQESYNGSVKLGDTGDTCI